MDKRGYGCHARAQRAGWGAHTLLDDWGIGRLPRVALDEPQAQRFLPRRLSHDESRQALGQRTGTG